MAGAFGYGRDTYDVSISMAVRRCCQPFVVLIRNALADGTSCRCQIDDGTGREATHMALFIDRLQQDRLLRHAGPAFTTQLIDSLYQIAVPISVVEGDVIDLEWRCHGGN